MYGTSTSSSMDWQENCSVPASRRLLKYWYQPVPNSGSTTSSVTLQHHHPTSLQLVTIVIITVSRYISYFLTESDAINCK